MSVRYVALAQEETASDSATVEKAVVEEVQDPQPAMYFKQSGANEGTDGAVCWPPAAAC